MKEHFTQITLPYEPIIRQIIMPLKKYGITYFTLDKKYHDGFTIRLSSESSWIKLYLDSHYDKIGAFELNPEVYQNGYMLWSELKQDPVYSTVAKEFKISNGLTLIKKEVDSCEFYNFGGNINDTSIVSFCLANFNLLEKFISHFREKMNTTLKAFRKQTSNTESSSCLNKTKNYASEHSKILSDTKKYYFYPADKMKYLTKLELDFLKTLTLGKTAEEIGMILNLSVRTCENHIQRIKKKLACKSLLELGFKFASLNLHEILEKKNG